MGSDAAGFAPSALAATGLEGDRGAVDNAVRYGHLRQNGMSIDTRSR